MARVATYLLSSLITPILDTGMYNLNRTVAIANAAANNGDYIAVATVQRAGRIVGCKQDVSATLGAGCVVQAAVYRAGVLVQNISAASTAAAASITTGVALSNLDVLAGDEIVLVVSGANVGAAATVKLDVHIQH
jgi:hypothetical protein